GNDWSLHRSQEPPMKNLKKSFTTYPQGTTVNNFATSVIALAASAAQESCDLGEGAEIKDIRSVDAGSPFIIPLLIPVDQESGDGRRLLKNSLSVRDLPISLLWQPKTGSGH